MFSSENYLASQNDRDHKYRAVPITKVANVDSTALAATNNGITTVSFDLNQLDSYWLQDDYSIWARFNIRNSASTGGQTVTPAFVESFFNASAVEYVQQGKIIYTAPMEQIAYEAPLFLSDDQYKKWCNMLNHDNAFASPVTLAASASAVYWVRLPTFLPKEGFPFCLLRGNTLRINLKLQSAVASAASGVLVLDDVVLCLNCYDIPASEIPEIISSYERRADKIWSQLVCNVNRPGSQITLVSTGESPKQKLDNLVNTDAVFLLHILRAARTPTNNGYFTYAALANTARVLLIDKNNTPLFAQTAEYITRLRNMESSKQFQDSNLLANAALIPTYIDENMQKVAHLHHVTGSRFFTGDEQLVIYDAGVTTSVYIDTIAWYFMSFQMDSRGTIYGEVGLKV